MGKFFGASVWVKCSLTLLYIGIVAWLQAGGVPFSPLWNSSTYKAYQAMLIIGIVTYYLAVLLTFLYIFVEETAGNKIVLIIALVVSFIAGVAGLIAGFIYRTTSHSERLVTSSVMAIIAGVFFVLEFIGAGGGGGGGGGGVNYNANA